MMSERNFFRTLLPLSARLKKFFFVPILGLGILLLGTGCSDPAGQPEVKTEKQEKPSEPVKANVSVNTEQIWVLKSVIQDAVQMAALASRAADPLSPERVVTVRPEPGEKGQAPVYTAAIRLGPENKSIETRIVLRDSVWSAETYTEIFGEILKVFQLTPSSESPAKTEDSLVALTTPISIILQSENRRVSRWLTEEPLNAEAHEQAALICAVLGLREQGRQWWDPRQACNRAVAHLGMARVLRQGTEPASDSGKIAELVLGLLLDQKADCTKRIAELEGRAAKDPKLKPWVMAAKLRNSRDWRLLQTVSNPTLLELLEGFRAKSEMVTSQAALDSMGKIDVDTLADWSRIVLQFPTSVQLSHRFDQPAVGKEVKDIVATLGRDRLQKPEDLIALLNTVPGGAVQKNKDDTWRFQVLDDGIWVQFFQRHLLYAIYDTKIFLRDRWGVKEYADQFQKDVESRFRNLSLFPMYDGWGAQKASDLSGDKRKALAGLMTEHPELVPSMMWWRFNDILKLSAADGYQRVTAADWFDPAVPTATSFTAITRLFFLAKDQMKDPAFIQPYLDIAPLQWDLHFFYVKAKYGEHPSLDILKSEFGEALDYCLFLMKEAAKTVENDPVAYPQRLLKIAEIDPDQYFALALYQVKAGALSQAAEAYQQYFDKATDRVGVSNQMDWLVQYYEDQGKRAEATKIAEEGAEVYSSQGLETMAKLMERRGNVPEAEAYFSKIQERYDEDGPLLGFYTRQVGQHPEYQKMIDGLQKDLFPGGTVKVTLDDFKGEPSEGVLVNETNELTEKAGLEMGAVIVALDGFKVNTLEQFTMLRSSNPSPVLKLIVYQRGGYVRIEASPPGKRFGIDISTYKK